MEHLILFFLYSLLFCLISLKLKTELKNGWNIETFFLVLINLFYIFIPLTMIFYNYLIFEDYIVPDLKVDYSDKQYYSYLSFFTTIIFLFFFYVGKTFSSKQYSVEYKVKLRIIKIGNLKISIIIILGFFFSILSLLSLFLYVSQFGSFENAIVYSNLVRSGYGEEVFVSTKFVFVKRFIYFSLLSILVYIFIENKTKLLNVIFLLVIPLSVTIFSKIFLFSGKQGILSLVLLVLFYLSVKNQKPYLNMFILFIISMVFLLPILDYIFLTKTNYYDGSFNSNISFIDFLGYFSFPQVSLQFAINNNYNYFILNDLIHGLKGTVLPFSWLKDWTIDSMMHNTEYFYGIKNKAIVPPGLFAFAFYAGGIIGIVIVAIISGYVVKKIDTLFKNIILTNPKFIIFYAFVINLVYTAVRTGMPKFNFYHSLFITFSIMIFLSFVIKKNISYK